MDGCLVRPSAEHYLNNVQRKRENRTAELSILVVHRITLVGRSCQGARRNTGEGEGERACVCAAGRRAQIPPRAQLASHP